MPKEKIDNEVIRYKKCNILSSIFYFKLFIEICCFICVCILVKNSKNDPFANHKIGNLYNYFYYPLNIRNKSKYNNNFLINNNTSNDYLFNETQNISSMSGNKRKLFLRNLVSKSFCIKTFDDFELLKGEKLLNIFDLNYDKIYLYSVLNLLLSCLLVMLFFIGMYIAKCFEGCCICAVVSRIRVREEPVCCSYCNIIFYIVFLIIYGTRFIMSFVLFYYMEKGDIEKYSDFLECSGVKVE